jgi:hypothetical protein
MNHLTPKQINQIKAIKDLNLPNLHGNKKRVGSLPVADFKEIMRKKITRARLNCTTVNISQIQKLKDLIKWSLECKGTPYFKILIEGNTGIYYASAVYGHRDYNKSRIFDKNEKTLKLMRLFTLIVNK